MDADSNREVLAYLGAQSLHCHGDLGQLLVDTARNLCGETLAYSPSFATFKYVALVTKRRIFALGENMTSACFRVPPELCEVAVERGGAMAPDIGAEWIRLELFQSNKPTHDVPFWMVRAYAHARDALGASLGSPDAPPANMLGRRRT